MGDERVDERAGPIARRRMDDEAARLVDDDDVVVLVDNGEGNRFGLGLGRFGGRERDRDFIARIDAVGGIADRAAADRDVPGLNEGFEARTRQLGDAGGQGTVEPRAGLIRRDGLDPGLRFAHDQIRQRR